MEWNNTNISVVAGLFLVGSIMAFLLIPLSQQSTIILTTPSGPASCLAPNDFVLPQQLDDLCDVVIISPSSGQIIEYNGTHWINVASTVFNDTTTCTNVGTGTAFVCIEGTNVDLRSLLAGTGISVSNDSNTITISNTSPESTVCTNVGNGSQVYKDGNCNFRTLQEFGNINIQTVGNEIFFSSYCSSVGSGISLCSAEGLSPDIDTLIAGTGITITDTTGDWTFASQCANTGTGEPVCESSNNINSLINGTGISITDTTGDLTITNTGVTSLTSADTGTISLSGSTGAITLTPNIHKLCEQTATGSETTMSCSLSTTPQAFILQVYLSGSTTNDVWMLRFNTDSGNNYATRSSTNGGADATSGNTNGLASVTITANQQYEYHFMCQNPSSGQEKHCYGARQTSANGSGNADSRVEFASKWANTANNISTVDLVRTTGTGTLNSGAYIIVWGVN